MTPAGCHPGSGSAVPPVVRSGFCRLCFLHTLLLSLPDGLPAGRPKSSTSPKAAPHNKGGSNAAHGFDEGLVTPTERIRAGQAWIRATVGEQHNLSLYFSRHPAVLIMISMFEGRRASNSPVDRRYGTYGGSALIRDTGDARLAKACARWVEPVKSPQIVGCERMWLLRCAGVLESGVIKAMSAEY